MSKAIKVMIFLMFLSMVVLLGASISANDYLWFIVLTLITILLFIFYPYVENRLGHFQPFKFYSMIFFIIFIVAIYLSNQSVTNNPQSVSLYYNQSLHEERVKITYDLFNGFEIGEVERSLLDIDINETPSGYVLAEPYTVTLSFFKSLYVFLGIPLLLAVIIELLNHTVSKRSRITKRENKWKVILTSGDRYGSKGIRSDHVHHQESYLSESVKADMMKDSDKD